MDYGSDRFSPSDREDMTRYSVNIEKSILNVQFGSPPSLPLCPTPSIHHPPPPPLLLHPSIWTLSASYPYCSFSPHLAARPSSLITYPYFLCLSVLVRDIYSAARRNNQFRWISPVFVTVRWKEKGKWPAWWFFSRLLSVLTCKVEDAKVQSQEWCQLSSLVRMICQTMSSS